MAFLGADLSVCFAEALPLVRSSSSVFFLPSNLEKSQQSVPCYYEFNVMLKIKWSEILGVPSSAGLLPFDHLLVACFTVTISGIGLGCFIFVIIFTVTEIFLKILVLCSIKIFSMLNSKSSCLSIMNRQKFITAFNFFSLKMTAI